MDVDISGWILEFLPRQNSLDDQTLTGLMRVLPLPNNNPRLKKTLTLWKLESVINKGTVSKPTIELLEQIEELDHRTGVTEVSAAMKAAYCTVAMHLTAKLVDEIAGDKKQKYASAVNRLWSGRVSEMERGDVRLVQEDLVRWVHDIEAGVLDMDVCENVMEMFKEFDVVKTVRRYVEDTKEKMGPSFIELACEAILNDEVLRKAMGLDEVSEFRSAAGSDGHCVGKDNEALKAHEDEVSKLNNQSKKGAPTDDAGPSNKGSGAKIVDPTETSHERYNYIPSPEVSKVQEALELSTFELHAAVKDPLPDALCFAESLKVNTKGENESHAHDHAGGNINNANDKVPNSSHDRNGKALQGDGDDDIIKDQNRRAKPSLFERNNTAHTTEWSDSIDSSDEGSPTRPHLPSPQRRKVSPLSVYKMEKLVRQRKRKRWTCLEEDTLRTGVQTHGHGNWKLILSMYPDIFEDRTAVDLKDKWRNLTH